MRLIGVVGFTSALVAIQLLQPSASSASVMDFGSNPYNVQPKFSDLAPNAKPYSVSLGYLASPKVDKSQAIVSYSYANPSQMVTYVFFKSPPSKGSGANPASQTEPDRSPVTADRVEVVEPGSNLPEVDPGSNLPDRDGNGSQSSDIGSVISVVQSPGVLSTVPLPATAPLFGAALLALASIGSGLRRVTRA